MKNEKKERKSTLQTELLMTPPSPSPQIKANKVRAQFYFLFAFGHPVKEESHIRRRR